MLNTEFPSSFQPEFVLLARKFIQPPTLFYLCFFFGSSVMLSGVGGGGGRTRWLPIHSTSLFVVHCRHKLTIWKYSM